MCISTKCVYKSYILYICKNHDLALNNLQTKPKQNAKNGSNSKLNQNQETYWYRFKESKRKDKRNSNKVQLYITIEDTSSGLKLFRDLPLLCCPFYIFFVPLYEWYHAHINKAILTRHQDTYLYIKDWIQSE